MYPFCSCFIVKMVSVNFGYWLALEIRSRYISIHTLAIHRGVNHYQYIYRLWLYNKTWTEHSVMKEISTVYVKIFALRTTRLASTEECLIQVLKRLHTWKNRSTSIFIYCHTKEISWSSSLHLKSRRHTTHIQLASFLNSTIQLTYATNLASLLKDDRHFLTLVYLFFFTFTWTHFSFFHFWLITTFLPVIRRLGSNLVHIICKQKTLSQCIIKRAAACDHA